MSSSTSSSVTYGGIGFFGLLTIVLIALKLTGAINIGWGIIATVFFAPAIIFTLVAVFGFAVILLLDKTRG